VYAAVLELAIGKFRKATVEAGKLLRNRKMWLALSGLVLLGSLIFTNLLASLGFDNEVGLHMGESAPLINPLLKEFLFSLIASAVCVCAVVAGLNADRKKPKSEFKPWQVTQFAAGVYLASILIMAFFRSRLAREIAAQFIQS